jgi:hypothetical protein
MANRHLAAPEQRDRAGVEIDVERDDAQLGVLDRAVRKAHAHRRRQPRELPRTRGAVVDDETGRVAEARTCDLDLAARARQIGGDHALARLEQRDGCVPPAMNDHPSARKRRRCLLACEPRHRRRSDPAKDAALHRRQQIEARGHRDARRGGVEVHRRFAAEERHPSHEAGILPQEADPPIEVSTGSATAGTIGAPRCARTATACEFSDAGPQIWPRSAPTPWW